MIKKLFLVFWILVLSSFLIYGLFIQDSPVLSPGPSSEIGEGCNVLQEDGDGINILFFSGREVAKDYLDYFLESEPFNAAADNFNFFYIEDEVPECELYRGDVFYCYSRELVKKSSVCPNDYIVVFGDYPGDIRSSAFMNVLSINSNHPKSVFLHEFGHVFAHFAEEYVDENAKIPSKAKNCVSSCEDFGEGVECFEGCTKSSYYRSSFESVMRTLNFRDYGFLNNQFISERIEEDVIDSNLFITGNAISSDADCSESEYYLVELGSGKVSKSVHAGCSGTPGYGDTEYLVLAEDDSVFLKGKYNNDLIFTTLPSAEGEISGRTDSYEGEIYLKIPVSKVKDGLKVHSTDLAILTEENAHLFEKRVDEKLSLGDVEKFGKRKKDVEYFEERRVVRIREDFSEDGVGEEVDGVVKIPADEKIDYEDEESGEHPVRETLFSLFSNLVSNLGNLLFSGCVLVFRIA